MTSVEFDRSLAEELRRSFGGTNVDIIEGDALEVPWPDADVIAGNIPYRTLTAPVHIYSEVESGNPQGAAAVSLVLLTLSLVLSWAARAFHARRA